MMSPLCPFSGAAGLSFLRGCAGFRDVQDEGLTPICTDDTDWSCRFGLTCWLGGLCGASKKMRGFFAPLRMTGLFTCALAPRQESSDDEGDAEGDENAFYQKDGVVAPAEEGEADDDSPHVDFAKEGEEPSGLHGGGGDSRGEGGNEAGDFGTVRRVGFA